MDQEKHIAAQSEIVEAQACDADEQEREPEDSALSEQNARILRQVAFLNKKVLCLCHGHGEEIAYALENGASECVAVCPSQAILDRAAGELARKELDGAKVSFHCMDAVSFCNECIVAGTDNVDIVVMLDCIEYLPREKCGALLGLLRDQFMAERGLLVVNTPAYPFDNDVTANGLDERNRFDSCEANAPEADATDARCNLFSTISLQQYLLDCGFLNLSEAHFFVRQQDIAVALSKTSYLQRWNTARSMGFGLQGAYADDAVEYARRDQSDVRPHLFQEGILKGITLCTTQAYINIAYAGGNIDVEAMHDLQQMVRDRNDLVVLDVGGFVGANAMVYAGLVGQNGKVVVFEPNPYNRNRIFINLSHNPHLESRVTVEKTALADQNGECEMNLSPSVDNGYSSTSRIEQSHATIPDDRLPDDAFVRHLVPVQTLDSYLQESGLRPDIIKIDIEGAETMMLQGATHTLMECCPICYIEYHSQYCATTCTQLLMDMGYCILPCTEEPDNRLIVKAIYHGVELTDGKALQKLIVMQSENMNALLQGQDLLRQFTARNFSLASKCDTLSARLMELATEKERLIADNARLSAENGELNQKVDVLTQRIRSAAIKNWPLFKPLRALRKRLKSK